MARNIHPKFAKVSVDNRIIYTVAVYSILASKCILKNAVVAVAALIHLTYCEHLTVDTKSKGVKRHQIIHLYKQLHM